MKCRPKLLTAFAIFLLLIAASFPLQIMFMYEHSPFEAAAVLSKLAPLNWAVMLICAVFSWVTLRGSRWMRLLAPVFLIMTIWNNWLVIELQPGASAALVSAVTILLIFAQFALFFAPSVEIVMRDPKIRWWLTPARRRVGLKAKICPVTGGEIQAMTFDVSRTGAFISTDQAHWSGQLKRTSRALDIGAHCSLRLALDSYRILNCVAKVIRHAESHGSYPAGFAIQFEGLRPEERRVLSRFLRKLKETAPEKLDHFPGSASTT